ncbi:MAG: dihydroorotate dehydrogenase electron transfer subunit [Candidatus Aenigmarchaeota archaeon]|nr:dihydroorotate dehydrogenase electron transfer subunit [Candidatus Aenigmarchaeota archaeon]
MSDKRIPCSVQILDRTDELIRLRCRGDIEAPKPGQFYMLWNDVSENPFSAADFSSRYETRLDIVAKRVGDDNSFTAHLFQLKDGDEIFVRGPYGKGFLDARARENETAYMIGGGCGIPPLMYLELLLALTRQPNVFMIGARNKDELNFYGADAQHVSTEDGSAGRRGIVTDLFDDVTPDQDSIFYICGPEKMMVAAAERAEQYTDPSNIVLLVERYMKCAVGLAGCCRIRGPEQNAYRVCVDGPAFTYDKLKGGDLGCYKIEPSGLRTKL